MVRGAGTGSRHATRAAARSVLGLVLLLVASLAGPAIAQPNHKSFTAAIDPAITDAGATDDFTATLVNTSTEQNLGSANLVEPAGWTLDSVGVPRVDGVPRGTATLGPAGTTIELRDLSAAPGSTVTVEFTATAPCAAGAYPFDAIAKQANHFQGPPGNDLRLNAAASQLTVTVAGGCGVSLNFLTDPADAEVGAVISSERGDPAGTPVQVEVLDQNDQRVTSSTASITVALGHNPTGATLSGTSGTLTRKAVDGVATFDDLTIDTVGEGYTLAASAEDDGLASAESDAFTIWEEIAACEAGESCTLTVERARELRVTVRGTAGQGGGTLFTSLTDDALDCGDEFDHAPYVTVLDSSGLDGRKTVELRIDKSVVRQTVSRGAAGYQICFEGDAAFPDRDGVLVPAGGQGLLPDCVSEPREPVPPCVRSKTKTQSGDVLTTALLPASDPRMW